MAKTFDPNDLEGQLEKFFTAADALRQQSLTQLADEQDEDAAILQDLRPDLARELGDQHPQIAALDRRLASAKRFVEVTRETARSVTASEVEVIGDWVVAGVVLDTENQPVAGAKVTLTGDPDLAKRFGEATSGKDGKFEVRFPGAEMKDVFTRAPKLRLAVRSSDDKLKTTSAEIVPKGDGIALLEIRLGKPAAQTVKRSAARKAPAADKKP
ncbi:MAG: carboxypeptidase-like regulatory domain-containing protein [Thermoanaerobaculia bacterium]